MKHFPIALLACLSLTACQTTAPAMQKTSLEIQAVQAKNFEADKGTTFKAVMSVLQDLGYVVSSASLETGFITADSPTKQDKSGAAVFQAAFGGVRTEGKTVVTAAVEDMSLKTTRVRLNFVNKHFRSARNGQQATDEDAVLNPSAYDNAFEKIGEAIFIRQAQK